MKSTAIAWTGPGRVELQEVIVPAPATGEVLVENVVSMVSPGTEAEWLSSAESHHVLQTTFPFTPGYSRIGRIAAIGEGVEGWELGDRVVSAFDQLGRPLGAHAAHTLTRAEDLDRIPAGVSFEQAAFFILGQTAALTVKLADVGLSDAVAIVGQGPIGNLAVQFARASGASPIIAFDLVESRRTAALAAGASQAFDPNDEEAFGAFLKESGGVAKVIDLTGHMSGTNAALQIAKPKGTVVLSTGFGGFMNIDYGAIFIKGLHLIGGYVNVDPDLARQCTQTYLRLIADDSLDVTALQDEPFAPEEAPEVYARVLAHDRSLVAPMFRWRPD